MKSVAYKERYLAVFNHAPHGMCITRVSDNVITEVNQAFLKLIGYSRKEVINNTSKSLNVWVDRSVRQNIIGHLLDHKLIKPQPYQFRTKKGETKYGIISAALISINHEPHILFETFDNTDNIRIEKEKELLIKQIGMERNRIYSVLDQMPVGVIITEAPTGKLMYANLQIETIFKQPPSKVSRIEEYQHLLAFHPNGKRLKLNEFPLTQSLLAGKTIKNQEIHITRGDNTPGVISVSSAPIRDDAGKIVAGVVIDVDITKQKLLEQQKDEFIGVASHELRTPITSIKAFVQVLESRFRAAGDNNNAALLQKLDRQINKLVYLIRNMLDVSRLEQEKFQLHVTPYRLDTLVKEVIEDTQLLTAKHNITFKNESALTVYGDRERIAQVLTNLLTNAIKFSPHASKIIVQSRETQRYVHLRVRDFGIGIPKNKQNHLFERFYRVTGNGYDTMPGIGLGLYITHEIVKRHRGKIAVTSDTGKGATFTVTLPKDIRQG